MEVLYKTILYGDQAQSSFSSRLWSPDEVHNTELLGIPKKCCEKMEEALKDEAISFELVDGELGDAALGNYVPALAFELCHPYPEGACYDYYGINFCPFCGEEVKLKEAKRVKLKKVEKHIPGKMVTDYEEVEV